MKKKVFLMLVVIAMIVFALAISASSVTIKFNGNDYTVTTYDDVPQKTNINVYNTSDVVVFADGFCCPTAYVFKDQNYINGDSNKESQGILAFDFEYINGKTGKEYTFADILKLDIPQGVVKITKRAFQDVTTLQEVSIPSSVTTIEHSAFETATGLKRCTFEHGENDNLKTLGSWMFYECENLEALSIPDCVTTIEGQCFFGKCTSLTAVYLSKNLVTLSYTGTNSHEGPFNEDASMYLVNDPFSYDSIPTKPEVYYFPSGLSSAKMTGVFFRNCASLNKVLVFDKDVTALSNTSFFEGCGNETIIFLGDMTNVSAKSNWPWSTKNIFFANANDKSEADVATLSLNSNQKAIFCHAEGNTTHIEDVRKAVITKEPTCVENAWKNTYCFCEAFLGEVEIASSYDSNKHDLENATVINITYADFSKEGYKTLKCICGAEDITDEAPALFACLGYSAPMNGEAGIAVGFLVNNEAIENYRATGKSISYGVFAVAQAKLGENTIFDENGNKANGVLSADVSSYTISAVEIRITGFADNQKNIMLSMGAYVTEDGKSYSYLQSDKAGELAGKYYAVSYNNVIDLLASQEVTE